MPTILENKQRRGQVVDQLKATKERVKAAGGLTDEDRSSIATLLAEDDQLKIAIEAAEADERLLGDIDNRDREVSAGGRRTAGGSGTHLGGTREASESDPKCGFRDEREFLSAVMRADRGRVDDRLRGLRMAAGSDEQTTQNDPYGGFLVPAGFLPEVLTVSAEADPTAQFTRKIPMSNPIVKIPARVDKNHSTSVSGGLTVTRKAETVAGNASRQKYEQISLNANSLFGLSYASEELLSDSPISFVALLEQGYRDEFAAKILQEKIEGTGVGAYLGVLNSPCTVTVSKESGQSADTLNTTNLLKMRSRCWHYGSAIWLANHDTIPQLGQLSVGSTVNYPVYMPSLREDVPDLLMGRPIFFTEFCPTLGDLGDVICGNWMEYLEGNYQAIQQAESMHVRFVEHERTFKFWLRNAGQPWWSSALTPKKSAATISPFVILEAR